MAAKVSKKGMESKATGTLKATAVGPFKELRTANTPINKPISMLPASPKNTLAGGKL